MNFLSMPHRVCTIHDLTKVKIYKIIKRCSTCKTYKIWPWIKMVKCKGCKMIFHRRCLKVTACDAEMSRCDGDGATEPTTEQTNCDDDNVIEAQRSDASTAIAIVAVRIAVVEEVSDEVAEEVSDEVADEVTVEVVNEVAENAVSQRETRICRVFVPPTPPTALVPPHVPPLPPYSLSSNITITDSEYYEDDTWNTISKIVKTADDGHVDEYLVVTKSYFTGIRNGMIRTVYIHNTPEGMICLKSTSVRTCPMPFR